MLFVVNRNTRTIHEIGDRGQSKEQCNIDDARKAGHLRNADPNRLDLLRDQGYRNCAHCMPPMPGSTSTGRASVGVRVGSTEERPPLDLSDDDKNP